MKLYRIIHFLLLLSFAHIAAAQKMSVAEFYLDETDLTANTEGTIVYDLNGEKCALIKIETTQKGLTFDGGSLGITKTEDHPGEIWLYVPYGLKRLTISHPQLGIIRNYDLGTSVQKARTYILKLTTEQILTTIIDASKMQILELTVTPKNATVVLNGVRETPDNDGRIIKQLSFGSYSCRVMSDNYHTYDGIITINDENNHHKIDITLKQAFGYLNVITDKNYNSSEVYVDDIKMGVLPLDRIPINSGSHKITILNSLYLPYETEVVIQDSIQYDLRVNELIQNYAIVTVKAVGDSEILIDNEPKGTGSWTGPLILGEHTIECRKESHRSTLRTINLNSTNSITYNCEPPTPIYGTIEVTSTPSDAEVYLDGVLIGTTPFVSQTILVGKHKVRLSKEGYKTEESEYNFSEGNTTSIQTELTDYCEFQLSTIPPGAKVFFDDEFKGETPIDIKTANGRHTILLTKDDYMTYNKTKYLNASSIGSHMNIILKRDYIKSNELYAGCNYRLNTLKGFEVFAGMYLFNINLECGWTFSYDKSDKVYWYRNKQGYHESYDEIPMSTTYGFSSCFVNIGYGFQLFNRARITPKIGINTVVLKEEKEADDYNTYANEAYTRLALGACNIDFALSQHLGISFSYEYTEPFSMSDGFKVVDKAINLKRMMIGSNYKIGTFIYF